MFNVSAQKTQMTNNLRRKIVYSPLSRVKNNIKRINLKHIEHPFVLGKEDE